MKLFALPALACLVASPAFADTQSDQLHTIEHFFENATVVSGPDLVDCTLSGGTETTCFKITVKPEPQSYTPGPWCPTSISDGPDAGGIWLKDGEVYDVDGAFITKLSELYDDDKWQLFDESTGEVRVTDTQESCEAAARPDVSAEYNNYCVQCLPEYTADDASMTYTIPLEPHASDRASQTGQTGSGIAYNGVRLDGPAPVDAITSAYTIAAFDDCGGHVNTNVGYHYHAATDCLEGVTTDDAHAAQIGLSMDGYGIFAHALLDNSTPTDLDSCNGHETDALGYHYHAGEVGSNAILGCLIAEAGCASTDPDAVCDASARRGRP